MRHLLRSTSFALVLVLAASGACTNSGGGSGDGPANNLSGTNRARFVYDLELQGAPSTLVMDVEVVGNTGITWGPGVRPDITGVISTGDYTVFTSGELRSAVAAYIFTGENRFADFTNTGNFERFRVQWTETQNGLLMTVNPFGRGPVTYECVLREVSAL